ncbi:unnamed protein product [Closterium sp. NIES-64]|nr:unnamed protein product [Closterium sp. NIES-64]
MSIDLLFSLPSLTRSTRAGVLTSPSIDSDLSRANMLPSPVFLLPSSPLSPPPLRPPSSPLLPLPLRVDASSSRVRSARSPSRCCRRCKSASDGRTADAARVCRVAAVAVKLPQQAPARESEEHGRIAQGKVLGRSLLELIHQDEVRKVKLLRHMPSQHKPTPLHPFAPLLTPHSLYSSPALLQHATANVELATNLAQVKPPTLASCTF